MYALIARTVLGPRGPDQVKELIEVANDTKEDITMRRAACFCFAVCEENSAQAIAFLQKNIEVGADPRRRLAMASFQFEVVQGLRESSCRRVAEYLIVYGDESLFATH
jgi:hypothetical protein